MLCFQYLEIEVKNPRTHIEKEKALYTDYEIELKVSRCFVSFESLGEAAIHSKVHGNLET